MSCAATPASVYSVYDMARTKSLTFSFTSSGYLNTTDSYASAYRIGNMCYIFFVLYIAIKINAGSKLNLIRQLPLADATSVAVAATTQNGYCVKVVIEKSTDVITTSEFNPTDVAVGDSLAGFLVYCTSAS